MRISRPPIIFALAVAAAAAASAVPALGHEPLDAG